MAIFYGNSIPAAAGDGGYYDYKINNSLRFNKDDSGCLTHPDSFSPTSPYTVSFWLKRGALGATNYAYRINSADNLYFDSADCLQVERRSGSLTTTRVFRDTSAWYHIVVRSTSSDYKLYVNGVLEQTTTSGANPYSAGTFNIGNSAPSTSTANAFDGYMAEWHWVDGQSLGPENFGEAGTYGDWKPIEYTGSHGTTGFYLNFANPNPLKSLSGNGNVVHSTSAYKFGSSSIAFDGSTDYISTPDSDDFTIGTGDMSFSCWARFNNFNNAQGHLFISHWNPGSDKGFRCMYSGGALLMDVWIGSEIQVVNQSWSASVDTWYHIRFTRTAGQFNVFVDGVKQGTGSTNTGSVNNSSGNIRIGSDGHVFTFSDMDGFLDDIEFTTSNQNGTSNFDQPIAYSTTTSSTKLLIQSNSSSNTSSTFVDSAGVSGGVGHDVSGNGKHFTPSNIDPSNQVTDSPTNNFCTWNSLNTHNGPAFEEGNLKTTGSGTHKKVMSTFTFKTGKWYYELLITQLGGTYPAIGVISDNGLANGNMGSYVGSTSGSFGYHGGGGVNGSGGNGGQYSSYTTGDIIGVACDMDNSKVYFYKNGSNAITSGTAYETLLANREYAFAASTYGSGVQNANFGQDGTFAGNVTAGGNADENGYGNFKYSVPSGFLSLCTANLPDPTVIPSEHFNTVLYTGTGGARSITGVGFQPDLHWLKIRAGESKSHMITDAVRGAGKYLQSDGSVAENNDIGTVASFDADGWSFGSATANQFNNSGSPYVAWNWKAGGTSSANTNGSISSTVSANTDAGFSIVTHSGTSSHLLQTIGHGLSKAPNLVITKSRNNADQWRVGTIQPIGSMDFTDYLRLNDAGAMVDESTTWYDTAPTSSVFTVGTDSATNYSGYTYVSYCFHEVEGYSKIGTYKGNSSTDGTFTNCGFRPQWLLIKPINYGDGWKMWDTTRGAQNGPYNQYPPGDLKPNQTNTENFSTSFNIDFVSNGFKWRGSDNSVNGGYNYLYYAIAEQPFKHTNAR